MKLLRKIKKDIATGSTLPTSFLLEGSPEMMEYRLRGTIRVNADPVDNSYQNHSGTSLLYLKFPKSMGVCHCDKAISSEIDKRYTFQLYVTDYGYIRVEWSRESVLIEVKCQDELKRVFRLLKKAGWEPEIVGERHFIRCPRRKVKYSMNRWEW